MTPPSAFDEYRLQRRLGQGGMGEVWLAHDASLDRLVAIKFIGARLTSDPVARERFLIEARAAARVHHPNVVSVFRVGELDGQPYLVSELIEGTPLSAIEKPVGGGRAVELGIGLARGLAAAHRRGVLHRDLKPANAMLGADGVVKLVDFGLAKLLDAAEAPALAAGSSPELEVGAEATRPLGTLGDAPTQASVPVGGLTQRGFVMGTPYYLSPELWTGEPATRASDLYALGAILWELCVGQPPFAGTGAAELPAAVITRDAPPLLERAPSVDPRFAELVDRCLARDVAQRPASAEAVLVALEEVRSARSAPAGAGNPYRGLLRFESEHRAQFFGRDAEMRGLVERLRSEPLVVVVGDSGVGKSSLCRAGVVPAALDEGLGGGRAWSAARMVPGRHPMASLRAALELPDDQGAAPTRVLDAAAAVPAHARVTRHLTTQSRGRLILIDQLEELVTLADPDEAREVAALLVHLLETVPGLRVIATARCDFLTALADLPGLGAAIERSLYLLRPMGHAALCEAILAPLAPTGVRFESRALIERLAGDAAAARGGLPLLQFLLAELWSARDHGSQTITEDAVAAIGGLHGALARHADHVVAALTPAQREQARSVLVRMVSSQGTRARRDLDELTGNDAAAAAALDALVRGRLIAVHQDARGVAYELAHEALLTAWSTLRDWLDADGDRQAARERLQRAAAEWERLGRTRDALLGSRALAESADLPADTLAPREQAFVRASRREATWRRWRLRIGIGALAAAALAGYLVFQAAERRDRAQRVGRQLEVGRAALADARARDRAVDATRSAAFAAFAAGDHEIGEAHWGEVEQGTAAVAAAYRVASRAFEAAAAIDGHDGRARGLLADTLYERAVTSERDRRTDERDEVIERLRLYDDGSRAAAWTAPATVTLTTTPPGATVRFAKLDGSWHEPGVTWSELGATPLAELSLVPGSYLFELSLPDHVPTRYPLRVTRGEIVAIDVPLLSADRVPAGMAYVPPGRSLIGSADTERKGFFNAAPMHPVDLDGFLIARTETTLGQWLAYVATLDGPARAAALPRAGSAGFDGMIEVVEAAPGRFHLHMQPATERFDADLDATITYRQRSQLATHAVADLPVSAISPLDAEAYVAWLDRSGQLPGARLCDEHEWERAARGADARVYPTGEGLPIGAANVEVPGSAVAVHGPDSVGSHRASDSVFGISDQAGNVWEFTRRHGASPSYLARGGAYTINASAAVSAIREQIDSKTRDISAGFRVCASIQGGQR